jgi:hypothetical protein
MEGRALTGAHFLSSAGRFTPAIEMVRLSKVYIYLFINTFANACVPHLQLLSSSADSYKLNPQVFKNKSNNLLQFIMVKASALTIFRRFVPSTIQPVSNQRRTVCTKVYQPQNFR